ncbi:MAG: N-acetyltransferase [Chitinophagaceae bacterium]|nr:MAG: N-acetyltransferase [Chitinophagaceae bacterium]
MNSFADTHIVLENDRARLEPLDEKHYDALFEIARQKEIWEFTSSKVRSENDFRRYFDDALAERKNKLSYPFAIFDKQENKYGGCTRFGNISLPNKRVEIGWTWYHPQLQRTGLNRNCKFLLLSFGFETLDLNRIELKTSSLNLKSQRAMEQIGAVKEGVLRSHMINEDGTLSLEVSPGSYLKIEKSTISMEMSATLNRPVAEVKA